MSQELLQKDINKAITSYWQAHDDDFIIKELSISNAVSTALRSHYESDQINAIINSINVRQLMTILKDTLEN